MALYNSTAWLTLIPAALASAAWLIPTQRYLRMYREEQFDSQKFIARYNQDREYQKKLNKYWAIACAIMLGVLIASLLLGNYLFDDFSSTCILITSVLSVYTLIVLIAWNGKQGPLNAQAPEMQRMFGVNIILGFAFVIEGSLIIFCFAALFFGIFNLLTAMGVGKYKPGFLEYLVLLVIIRMTNSRPLFEDRLLIFSYLLMHPKEKSKKKNIA